MEADPRARDRRPAPMRSDALSDALSRRAALAAEIKAFHAALAGLHAGNPDREERLRALWDDRTTLDAAIGALVGRWLDRGGRLSLHAAEDRPPQTPHRSPTPREARGTDALSLEAHPSAPNVALRAVSSIGNEDPTPAAHAIADPPPEARSAVSDRPVDDKAAETATSTTQAMPVTPASAPEAMPETSARPSRPGAEAPARTPTKTSEQVARAPEPPNATGEIAEPPTRRKGPPASAEALRALKEQGIGSAAPDANVTPTAQGPTPATVLRAIPLPGTPDPHTAVQTIHTLTRDLDAWSAWPRMVQRQMLQLLASTCRALQSTERMPGSLDTPFRRMTAWSKKAQPGSVHGLARKHLPRSASWSEDARRDRRALRATLDIAPPAQEVLNAEVQLGRIEERLEDDPGRKDLQTLILRSLDVLDPKDKRLLRLLDGHMPLLKGEKRLKRLRKALRDHQQRRDQQQARNARPDGYPDANWPHFATTRDASAVIVGGDPRPQAQARIQEAFGFAEIEWIDPSDHRRVESLERSIRQHAVGVVILLRSYTPHAVDNTLRPALKATDTPWISVDQGYGVTQVRRAMERFWTD